MGKDGGAREPRSIRHGADRANVAARPHHGGHPAGLFPFEPGCCGTWRFAQARPRWAEDDALFPDGHYPRSRAGFEFGQYRAARSGAFGGGTRTFAGELSKRHEFIEAGPAARPVWNPDVGQRRAAQSAGGSEPRRHAGCHFLFAGFWRRAGIVCRPTERKSWSKPCADWATS